MRYKTLDEKSARLQVKRRSIKPVDPLFTAHHFFNIPRNNSLKYFTPPPQGTSHCNNSDKNNKEEDKGN